MQQLTLGIGVALAALMVDTTRSLQHHTNLTAGDFWPSLVVLAALSGMSSMPFFGISKRAGSDISGHRASRERTAVEASANEQE